MSTDTDNPTIDFFAKPEGPGLPTCQPCRATERKLEQLGIPYQKHDVSMPENTALARDLGHTEAPVVTVSIQTPSGPLIVDHWAGYRPDKLDEWARKLAAGEGGPKSSPGPEAVTCAGCGSANIEVSGHPDPEEPSSAGAIISCADCKEVERV